jgi:predicted dehydrogenase
MQTNSDLVETASYSDSHAESPIVDCGVHWVDLMCQITDAAPLRVNGMGLRLSDDIAPDIYNYGSSRCISWTVPLAGNRRGRGR